MNFLISVIIPVYRVEKSYIKRCVDSVLAQGETAAEILVVQDGDTGDYRELYMEYLAQADPETGLLAKNKSFRWITKAHEGVSAARNRGISEAAGKWILFLDADDWLSDGCFEAFHKDLEELDDSLIMFDYCMEYANGTVNPHQYRKTAALLEKQKQSECIAAALRPQSGMGFCWGKFFAAGILKERGVYFNPELSMAEDADFVIRSLDAFEAVYYSGRQDYHYWFNAQSAVRRYREDYAEQFCRSMNSIKKYVKKNLPDYQVVCDNFILYHLLLIAINASFHPDNPRSFRGRLKSFKELAQSPLFADAMKNVWPGEFSLTRRAAIYCVRAHFYVGVAAIAKVRHMQFRRK